MQAACVGMSHTHAHIHTFTHGFSISRYLVEVGHSGAQEVFSSRPVLRASGTQAQEAENARAGAGAETGITTKPLVTVQQPGEGEQRERHTHACTCLAVPTART
jgi:hypothetical protein